MYRWISSLFIVLVALTMFTITPRVSAAPSDNDVAPRSSIAATTTALASSKGVTRPEAYREYWCRTVTASTMRLFSTSTSTTPIYTLYQGDVFATTGIANNRYHVYDPFSDTWLGWVSADPQWTNYAGHYCVG